MIRELVIIGAIGTLFVLGGSAAEAKTIDIAFVSRSDIQHACVRAGGQPYGIDDETAIYGCYAGQTVISCTPDDPNTPDNEADCQASVADTRPLTGTSLGYILGFGKPAPASQMITPLDARLLPDWQALGSYTPIKPIAPVTAPSSLPPWAPPFTDPYAPRSY
jgi:hypothetical protein